MYVRAYAASFECRQKPRKLIKSRYKMVIVHQYTKDMHDQMIDFTVELELEYDQVLSVLLIDYENFREWEHVLPFYKNVKKDGVTLWSAA